MTENSSIDVTFKDMILKQIGKKQLTLFPRPVKSLSMMLMKRIIIVV